MALQNLGAKRTAERATLSCSSYGSYGRCGRCAVYRRFKHATIGLFGFEKRASGLREWMSKQELKFNLMLLGNIPFILLVSRCMFGMVAERKDAASWRSFDGPPAEEFPPLDPGALKEALLMVTQVFD